MVWSDAGELLRSSIFSKPSKSANKKPRSGLSGMDKMSPCTLLCIRADSLISRKACKLLCVHALYAVLRQAVSSPKGLAAPVVLVGGETPQKHCKFLL